MPCMESHHQGTSTRRCSGSGSSILKHVVTESPLLLVFDTQKSLLEVIVAAKREGLILLCLPPHCTYVLQPLKMSVFGPLKEFSKVTGHLSHFKNSNLISRYSATRTSSARTGVLWWKVLRSVASFLLTHQLGSRLMPSWFLSGPRATTTASPGDSQEPSTSLSSSAVTDLSSHHLSGSTR